MCDRFFTHTHMLRSHIFFQNTLNWSIQDFIFICCLLSSHILIWCHNSANCGHIFIVPWPCWPATVPHPVVIIDRSSVCFISYTSFSQVLLFNEDLGFQYSFHSWWSLVSSCLFPLCLILFNLFCPSFTWSSSFPCSFHCSCWNFSSLVLHCSNMTVPS